MSITQPTPQTCDKKKDTTFGEMIEKEAKKIYGNDFEFHKCIVEKIKNYTSAHLVPPVGDFYVVTFVLENHPKDQTHATKRRNNKCIQIST